MSSKAFIRNAAEYPWINPPGHSEGAYSKMLVCPDNSAARHLDYRISSYQPKACVYPHAHRVQEQIYHVLEGEGLMEIDGQRTVVRRHDVIFLAPGVEHAIYNTGFQDLIFLVVTAPASDAPAADKPVRASRGRRKPR
ncbi:MAG TPA: cupin domain-containing protein [Burkholderiales bacterium]|nr:cupin domain-containing protein [Burkholderiales bacterium]